PAGELHYSVSPWKRILTMRIASSGFFAAAYCLSAVALGFAHPQDGPGDPKKGAKQQSFAAFIIGEGKGSTYCGKRKMGELLAQYCNKPVWHYDQAKNRVQFQGVLKKGGGTLVVRFRLNSISTPGDKSETNRRLVVVDEAATLDGKQLSDWQQRVFVDED